MQQIIIKFGHLMASMDFKNSDITMITLFPLMEPLTTSLTPSTGLQSISTMRQSEKFIRESRCTVGTSTS
jgi:hypothetical protein